MFGRFSFVRQRYPILPIADKPILQNVDATENKPYESMAKLCIKSLTDIVNMAKTHSADGVITDEEKVAFQNKWNEVSKELKFANDKASKLAKSGFLKNSGNYNSLIKVERKLRVTIEIYNKMARNQNEMSGYYNSIKR